MTKPRTADDFPTVIDALLYYSAEIDRLAALPASHEKNEELKQLPIFLETVTDRIQREKSLRGGESYLVTRQA